MFFICVGNTKLTQTLTLMAEYVGITDIISSGTLKALSCI